MKNFVKLLLNSLLFFSITTLAMENTVTVHSNMSAQHSLEAPITYDPITNVNSSIQSYSLYATMHTKPKINLGSISYSIDKQKGKNKISDMWVSSLFQRNGIGFNLFQRAVVDMIDKSPTIKQITWKAVPYGISLEALTEIYQKMVKRLGPGFELSMKPVANNGKTRKMILKIV